MRQEGQLLHVHGVLKGVVEGRPFGLTPASRPRHGAVARGRSGWDVKAKVRAAPAAKRSP
ncbi:hypothetical protein Sros_0177 [Streptosporangium roseum DSM 43021]|uniref:Uncharacterized protein n=1 Tax=Streptosporangium roseum (strain ATCC 12428 / DSM 43021 / JCM 3005 / KCTC 9067 / NCIMB 10171 / NRRL 2505 / NI 9100) TaxID=479432 RepID=D2AXP7_STRRD|nr:hypothetical protein Sros_0177 [Streptosporangium roseum DSM 43021]